MILRLSFGSHFPYDTDSAFRIRSGGRHGGKRTRKKATRDIAQVTASNNQSFKAQKDLAALLLIPSFSCFSSRHLRAKTLFEWALSIIPFTTRRCSMIYYVMLGCPHATSIDSLPTYTYDRFLDRERAYSFSSLCSQIVSPHIRKRGPPSGCTYSPRSLGNKVAFNPINEIFPALDGKKKTC